MYVSNQQTGSYNKIKFSYKKKEVLKSGLTTANPTLYFVKLESDVSNPISEPRAISPEPKTAENSVRGAKVIPTAVVIAAYPFLYCNSTCYHFK